MKQEENTSDNIRILTNSINRQANSNRLIKIGHTIFNKLRLGSNSIMLPPQIEIQVDEDRYSQQIVQALFSSQVLRIVCSQSEENFLKVYTRYDSPLTVILINKNMLQFWKGLFFGIQESNFEVLSYFGQNKSNIFDICSVMSSINFINLQWLQFCNCHIDNIQFLQTFNTSNIKEFRMYDTKITNLQPLIKCQFNINSYKHISFGNTYISQYNKTSRINFKSKNSNNLSQLHYGFAEIFFSQNREIICFNDMRSLIKLKNDKTNIIVDYIDQSYHQQLKKREYPIVQSKIFNFFKNKIYKIFSNQDPESIIYIM